MLARHPESSFLQNPVWAQVKSEWRSESVGIVRDGQVVGAALVLKRPLPVPSAVPLLGKAYLAYISEGPVLDDDVDLLDVLPPLQAHLKADGAFMIRMGPPGVVRRWDADVLRKALKDESLSQLMDVEHTTDVAALELQERLRAAGWRAPAMSEDFAAGQPMFQARVPLQGLDVDGVLARMNQTSRSETRKSTRTELDVTEASAAELPSFMATYQETAEREGFNGRAQSYFERVLAAFADSPVAEASLYLARHEGQDLAGAIAIRQGHFAWYPYGGSSVAERKRFAPRALQLTMIEAAVTHGCHYYDLGGVGASVAADHKLIGLMRFKTALGADVIQTHGEWDLPLNRVLAKAFDVYMARR